ncbi:MAG: O-antigen ligase family protein [Elusimicrobiota bacterium]
MKNVLYFAIVVCPLIFFTNVTRNPYIIQGTILYISLLLIFILFAIRSIKTGKIIFYRTRLDLPILIFLGWTIFTFLHALFGSYEIAVFGKIPGFSTAAWSEGLRNNLYILINCVLAYYVAVNFIRDEKSIKKVLFLSFVVAFIASIYAVLQYFDMEPIWQQTVNPYGIKRCVSTFGNPVFLSSFLVIVIPLSIVLFISSKSNYSKFLYIFLTATMILALFVTMARSSWLGLGVSFIVIFFSFKEKILVSRKWFLGLFLIIVLFMFVPMRWQNETKPFGFYVIERATSILSLEKSGSAAYQRFLIWLSAWDISKQNPVVGCGWGLFEMLFPFYQQRYLIHPNLTLRTHANNAHNVLLENLSQTGIIGLGIFLWLIFCIVKFGIHQIKNIPATGGQKTIAVGIFAGVIGMLVDNIVNVTLYFVIPGFFFWMNLGILSGLGTSEKKVFNHNIISKIFSVISISISILLIIVCVSIFYAEKNYFTGFKFAKSPSTPIEQAIPYLEKAYKLRRLEVNNNYELANGYARMSARLRNAEGAISRADEYQKKTIRFYKEALAANPGYDEIYFNMATIYAQRKEFDIAEENYKRAIFINPFSIDAVMGLGNIYLFSEKYEPARNLYRRAAFISTANKDIWNNLGYVNMKLNRVEEAKDCYEKALTIDPNFELAKKNLSNITRYRITDFTD